MTLSPEERRAIVAIRIRNAESALEDARVLLDRSSLRGAANRLYYAAYHAVSALALSKGAAVRTHRGVIGFFHTQCIQGGLVDVSFAYVFQKAFEDRSEADYEDDVALDASTLAGRAAEVSRLIEVIRKLAESGPV